MDRAPPGEPRRREPNQAVDVRIVSATNRDLAREVNRSTVSGSAASSLSSAWPCPSLATARSTPRNPAILRLLAETAPPARSL